MLARFACVVVVVALAVCTSTTLAKGVPASQPAQIQPIDFEKLKAVMPSTLASQPQRKTDGEKVSAAQMLFSHATADYGPKEASDDAPAAVFEIIDYSADKPRADAATGWQNLHIDREDENGWEKTTTIDGQPAYLSFQNDGRNGQAQVFVAGRYYLHLQTANLGSDDFKKAAAGLPIQKIAALK